VEEVRNLNKKRVGDLSKDRRKFEIHIKDCTTIITTNPDGTLNITQTRTIPSVQ
jgi:hypothetical protein